MLSKGTHLFSHRVPLRLLAVVALAIPALGVAPAATASSGSTHESHVTFRGTINLGKAAGPSAGHSVQIPPHPPLSKRLQHGAASTAPSVSSLPISSQQLPGFSGFNGLTGADQAAAGSGAYAGSQYDLEPPDQGLCVGPTRVIEPINDALQVYSKSGSPKLPGAVPLNQFFLLAPEVTASSGTFTYGDFTSDPRCYYDTQDNRWFLTALQIAVDPTTGAFGNTSEELIAVSQSGDPEGTWYIYSIDTTDNGTDGTPADNGCPCFGDQPLMGADAYGFYVTTNEYGISSSAYNGAQVYAISKSALEAGPSSAISAVHLQPGTWTSSLGGLAFSIEPATSPSPVWNLSNGGTEYFMSATDWGAAPALGTRANSLLVWALTGTSSLSSASPDVALSYVQVASELYAQPPNAVQEHGPTPLADTVHSPEGLISGNDDRLFQVTFADGKLWSSLNTAAKLPNGPTNVGGAYFVVTPADAAGTLSASLDTQGYIGLDKEDVIYPSVGVTPTGKAVVTFTVVGPDYFPSAAYAPLSLTAGLGPIRIAAAGTAPEDGFTPLKAFGGSGVARWGDYSAAVSDPSGTIWMADEFIGNEPRDFYTNWDTFVYAVTP